MKKVLKHLKNNLAIYLVLLASLVIIGITFFITNKEKDPKIELNTKEFAVVDTSHALGLFDDNEAKLILIGSNKCKATEKYIESVIYASIKGNYHAYYLETTEMNQESKETKEFLKKLDLEYTFNGVKGNFGDFMGSTPMTVIIKNKKMVYGYIGSMSTDALEIIGDKYGL